MKRWLIVAMIASLWGGFVQTASAADMGVPRTPPSPVPVPAAYDWSGVYIGGHIGGGCLQSRSRTQVLTVSWLLVASRSAVRREMI
jgi:opacity protein-like surface antigen